MLSGCGIPGPRDQQEARLVGTQRPLEGGDPAEQRRRSWPAPPRHGETVGAAASGHCAGGHEIFATETSRVPAGNIVRRTVDAMLWRVRMTMPDRPGALATLAQECGVAGVNILAMQVFPGVEAVTDDFVLEVPGRWEADDVAALVERAGARAVVSHPCTEQALVDQPSRYVEAARTILAQPARFPEVVAALFDADARAGRRPGGHRLDGDDGRRRVGADPPRGAVHRDRARPSARDGRARQRRAGARRRSRLPGPGRRLGHRHHAGLRDHQPRRRGRGGGYGGGSGDPGRARRSGVPTAGARGGPGVASSGHRLAAAAGGRARRGPARRRRADADDRRRQPGGAADGARVGAPWPDPDVGRRAQRPRSTARPEATPR